MCSFKSKIVDYFRRLSLVINEMHLRGVTRSKLKALCFDILGRRVDWEVF